MEKEDVAESFPGTVAIIDDKVNNTLLHPNDRRYGLINVTAMSILLHDC